MLEADEVDDDYFTPVSNTPLANLFNASSSKATTNDLKYTPPKRPIPKANDEPKPEEDSKATECIFVCALMAYEWANNNYAPRGKVGFAVVKNIKIDSHNIILYNSNKTTLSSTLITPKLNITIKGNNYISYYDDFSKYWSIYAKEDEVKKITETLKNLAVVIKHTISMESDENPLEPISLEHDHNTTAINQSEKESDTDSSINRRAKASILNRMANMGHSVLPQTKQSTESSSDSSDTSKTDKKHSKVVKHKPKTLPKRPILEIKNTERPELLAATSTTVAVVEPTINTSTLYTFINGQLVPVTSSSIITNHGNISNNEMNLFIAEQRISNSELRININRTTDKLDQVIEKFKTLDRFENSDFKDFCRNSSSTDFQIEIMQKLVAEYENKIKMYEKILATSNMTKTMDIPITEELSSFTSEQSDEIKTLKSKITDLECTIKDKDKEITRLNGKLEHQNNLLREISNLKQSLDLKSQELESTSKKLEELINGENKETNKEFESKLKYAMNDVFQTISSNFQSNKTYSSEHIKSVVATVIRKVTVQSVQSISEYST